MHNKLAHTAEHAFIGSIQNILGTTLSVRKVEHREKDNSVFIKISRLDLEVVIKAQYEVNFLIGSGRKIKTHSFETLSEAKQHIPNLRANEERIKQSSSNQQVRVVEIEGHDIAACAMDHVNDLSECEFFLVTRTSRIGDEYEINFVVGKQAKETAMLLSLKLLSICQEIGANLNTVENTIKKLNDERKSNTKKLKRLTAEFLDNIVPFVTDNGRVKVIQGILFNLDDEEIRIYAGKKITEPNEKTVVIIANINSDLNENASFVFARSESLDNIDCNRLFRQYCSIGARGGGKSNFVTGVIKRERVTEIIANLNADVKK
jgi:alanyl-tRNA synthetase